MAADIYRETKEGSWKNDYSLRDQIRRSAVSIPSNIAEGYERNSRKDFIRFLKIAKASCGEFRTQLYIAKAIGYMNKETFDKFHESSRKVSAMIQSLINSIRD